MMIVMVIARQRSEMHTAEGQFQLWNVDLAVAVHVKRLHQRPHFPGWKVSDVGVLERRLEFIGVNFTRLVQVDGVEEPKHRLSSIGQIVGQHQQFFWVFIMMVIIVWMEVMVSMMHFVNHRSAGHEEHAFGHGVVEQMEEGGAEGDDDDAVVDVIVGVLASVSEVLVPVQGVGQVEGSTKSREDVGKLRHRGVGEDLLQVVLNEGDGGGHNGRRTTDGSDDEGQVSQLAVHGLRSEEGEHTGDEIETGVDHRGCVNESRNGGRSFHGVGEPNVKRELG